MQIVAGIYNRRNMESSKQFRQVIRIHIHPEYRQRGTGEDVHDIALLELGEDLAYNGQVQPVCLTNNDALAGQNCVVAGWGTTHGEMFVQVPEDFRRRDIFSSFSCLRDVAMGIMFSLMSGTGDSSVLNQVYVPIIPHQVCARRDYYGNRVQPESAMICAGYERGSKDSCQVRSQKLETCPTQDANCQDVGSIVDGSQNSTNNASVRLPITVD